MAVREPDPHWLSDIFQTELRVPQERSPRLCVLPPEPRPIAPDRLVTLRKCIEALSDRFRPFLAHRPPVLPVVSCDDPVDAYVQACMAASFFCYVSPSIYGLGIRNDERATGQAVSQPGDDV